VIQGKRSAETCLHFEGIVHQSTWIDLPIHDWIAGAFLICGGVASRRNWTKGRPYQAAAWSFMCSLLVAALVGHWEELSRPPQSDAWIPARAFVVILGGLAALSLGAVAGTLVSVSGSDS
jgi:hypothetical protein